LKEIEGRHAKSFFEPTENEKKRLKLGLPPFSGISVEDKKSGTAKAKPLASIL
jgi:hypothetical protein